MKHGDVRVKMAGSFEERMRLRLAGCRHLATPRLSPGCPGETSTVRDTDSCLIIVWLEDSDLSEGFSGRGFLEEGERKEGLGRQPLWVGEGCHTHLQHPGSQSA